MSLEALQLLELGGPSSVWGVGRFGGFGSLKTAFEIGCWDGRNQNPRLITSLVASYPAALGFIPVAGWSFRELGGATVLALTELLLHDTTRGWRCPSRSENTLGRSFGRMSLATC
jgi:hypothetical protein